MVGDQAKSGHQAGSEGIDPLELVCELAQSVGAGIQEGWIRSDLMIQTREVELLRRARRFLIQNARHVPLAVDEAIELAEAHAVKKRQEGEA